MDHPVDLVSCKHLLHLVVVANIRPHEPIIGLVLNIAQICQITGISQFIEINDTVVRILVHQQPHHMRTDKTRTSGHQQIPFSHNFSYS